jgi:hypothetical protein
VGCINRGIEGEKIDEEICLDEVLEYYRDLSALNLF